MFFFLTINLVHYVFTQLNHSPQIYLILSVAANEVLTMHWFKDTNWTTCTKKRQFSVIYTHDQPPYGISMNFIYIYVRYFYLLYFILCKGSSEVKSEKQSQEVKFLYSKLLIEKLCFCAVTLFAGSHCQLLDGRSSWC